MMRRREFIAGLGGAAALSVAGRAQQRPMPIVGFLNGASAIELAARAAAFRDGLAELGHVEGRNVAIDYRWGDGHYDRLPAFARDLARRRAAVIAATGGIPSVRAAMAATSDIPIVFTMGANPVEAGIVASLNRPGGNVTGVTLISGEITSKRMQLLHDLNADIRAVAILVNPAQPSTGVELAIAQEIARTLRWQVRILTASDSGDLELAFESLSRDPVNALLITTDPALESRREHIVSLAARSALAAIYPLREYSEVGGLMSYGASITHIYRQAGIYAGRILNGEKAAELPIQQATRFELVINLKAARALGIAIPETLLATADEVIQ